MHTDWQTVAAFCVGLGALVYVSKRWWPGLAGLFNKTGSAHGAAPAAACGQPALANPGAASGASSCGSGCGSCGQGATMPAEDHRVQITRRAAD